MARYDENAYNWLKRKGLAEKYEHAGIYCIKIDEKIVYIGKSHNMLKRVAQHYAGIQMQSERKYRILAEAQRKDMPSISMSFTERSKHDTLQLRRKLEKKRASTFVYTRPHLTRKFLMWRIGANLTSIKLLRTSLYPRFCLRIEAI